MPFGMGHAHPEPGCDRLQDMPEIIEERYSIDLRRPDNTLEDGVGPGAVAPHDRHFRTMPDPVFQ